jgi:hypothetical protein
MKKLISILTAVSVAATLTVPAFAASPDSVYNNSYAAVSQTASTIGLKAAGVGNNHIKLAWNAVQGAYAYMLYQAAEGDTAYTPLGAVQTTDCLLSNNYVTGKQYHFVIQPIYLENGAYRYGEFSAPASAVCLISAAPVLTATGTAKDKATLSWYAIPGADFYTVYMQQGNGWVKLGDINGVSYNLTGLNANSQYHFYVTANSLGVVSPASNVATAHTQIGIQLKGVHGVWYANNFNLGGATSLTLNADGTFAVNGENGGRFSLFVLDDGNREVYVPIGGKTYTLNYNSYNDRLYYGNNYFYKA